MIHLVLPNAEMRDRLQGRLSDVEASIWRPGSADPFPGRTELLVLPYMIPASELGGLDGLPVGVVQSQTLGYDGVAEHLPKGLVYCNAVGVHEASTGELALGLVLASLRGIADAVRSAGRGEWRHRRQPGLSGKRVLLLGAGGVGAEIEKRLEPFGAELRVVARTPRGGIFGLPSLPGLLPWADVVIVAIPLTDQTRGFVDAGFLARMRDGALIVNVSRGEVFDTGALLAELLAERLHAALDVTDPEPLPPAHPLWSAPNVLITPHLGGDTEAMDARMDRIVVEQLRRLRAGEAPLHVVYGADR